MTTSKKDEPDDKDKERDPRRREKPEQLPAEPPVQEYPKMLYHPDGRTMTVGSADEEAAWLKEGFVNTPQPAPTPPAPKG